MNKTKKILVVGQTPPPYGGQALMTKRLVEAKLENVEIIHVRLAFSESFQEVGRASLKKLTQVFKVVAQVWKHRIRHKNLVLYYMPAGPNKVPVIRDLLLLSLVRPFFRKTIYHFRAAGISEFIKEQPYFFQKACRIIYGKPSIGIQLSSLNPPDAAFFSAKRVFFVPNGMEDSAANSKEISQKRIASNQAITKILYVGVLREDKGFSWLLDALHLLQQRKVTCFQLLAMGEFNSAEYKKLVEEKIIAYNLQRHVTFLGVQIGQEKWKHFCEADMFCFPTFFDCESFGNVVVEAMMFQLPVIGSRWRGVPDIVSEDIGFLVPVKDTKTLSEKIQLLIEDEMLRKQMGINARKRYLEKYTLDHFLGTMQSIFQSVN